MESNQKPSEINPTMSDNNCSDAQNDDTTIDAAELLAAASEGRADDAIKILEKEPTLIQVADLARDTALQAAMKAGHVETVSKIVEFLDKSDKLELLAEVFCDDEFALGDASSHLVFKAQIKATARSMILGNSGADEEDNSAPFELSQEEHDGLMDDIGGSLEVNQHLLPADIQMSLASCALSDEDSNENDNDDEDEEEDESQYWELYEAIEQGKEQEVLQMLEEDPGLIQSHDPQSGYNVIEMAASCGHLDLLKRLMHLRQEIKRSCGKSALQLAIENGHCKAALYLIDAASPEVACAVDLEGRSPLYLAVEKGHLDLVEHMIRTHICKSTRERMVEHAEKTFLAHVAVKLKDLGMLQTLMEGMPDLIHATDRKGWKPLSYAAYRGHLGEVRYFLKSFPESVTMFDADGTLPIHKAGAGGHVAIVKEFLSSFPKTLHHVDKKGRTLLHIATRYNCNEVVSYLREHK